MDDQHDYNYRKPDYIEGPSMQSKEEMRSLLESLNDISSDSSSVRQAPQVFNNAMNNASKQMVDDPFLLEALDNDLNIGSSSIFSNWQVVNDNGVFSVLNSSSGDVIANSMMLQESATAIAKMLNSGVPLTNRSMTEILSLAYSYNSNLIEMKIQKKRILTLKESKNPANKAQLDTSSVKYDTAREKAIACKNKTIEILKNL